MPYMECDFDYDNIYVPAPKSEPSAIASEDEESVEDAGMVSVEEDQEEEQENKSWTMGSVEMGNTSTW